MKAQIELLEEQIFTKFKTFMLENLFELEGENISMTQSVPSDAQLPFVYIHLIVPTETARDLECDRINGGLFTYEARVTSNVSQEEAKRIMTVVAKAFKSMGFWGTSLPYSSDVNNLHVRLSRWQREINEGDEI